MRNLPNLAWLPLALGALVGCAASAPPAKTASAAPPQTYSRDPYPSTYHRYPGVLTAITGGTVYDGEGGRIENGTVILADGVVQAIGGPDTPIPAGATRIDAHGKWVTPGIIDVHSPPRRLSLARGRGAPGRQRVDRPRPPRRLGRAQRLAAGSGLQPRARQWRRHHAGDPARLGRPVRRPLGRAQERAGAHRPGDEIPGRALRPQDGVRRESQARLWQPQPDARQPDGQYRARPRDLGARGRV